MLDIRIYRVFGNVRIFILKIEIPSLRWAIFDANVVAAFTAGILFYYGTGPVRGFAVSLLIGIATTMFTAIFVTKTFLELAEDKIKIKEQGA